MMEIKLGDYVKIKTGKLNANAQDENGVYPFFTCAKEISSINTYAYDCECVLVAGNGILNAKYYKGKFNAYQRVYIIEVKDKEIISTRFLFYFIDKYMEKLRNGSIGGIIKYIKLNHLTDITLDLPDLPTQNKIVALLDKASALVQKRENCIDLLDELLRAQFLDMFGDPLFDDKGFQVKELIEVCNKITDGTHQSPKFLDKGIPFILVSNIVNNVINLNTKKFISQETYYKLTKNTKIEVDDILITSVGSYGNPAIVDFKEKFCFQRHIAHIKPKHDLVNVVFLFEQLKSDLIQRQIERVVKGVAQKTLNLKALKGLSIILPPIELQNQFETIYHNIQSQKETLTLSKIDLQNLHNGLLQRAFSGQLNFNEDIELDALLAAIDVDKEENDIRDIATVYASRLLERLESQDFENQNQYQQAKQVAFQMLKEGAIEQEYDTKDSAVKMKLV